MNEKNTKAANRIADLEKTFIKTFRATSYKHNSHTVWHDFVTMTACALSNPLDKSHREKRENRYLDIIKRYDKQEQQTFPELLDLTIMALEHNQEQDFLGDLYTQLGLCNKELKQDFTPYSVCQLMADITVGDVVEQVKEKGYVTLDDPSCGSGATLIAGVHAIRKRLYRVGLNFQNHVLVSAQDIDETVALMCYVQLSLLGIAAYIKVGDSLIAPMAADDTLENYWFTPMYFSDVWRMRRIIKRVEELTSGTQYME